MNLIDPTGMGEEPPIGLDAEDGAVHSDSDGSWKYNKSSNTWVGQNGSSDIENAIQLDEVDVSGKKDNSYFSGYFKGPASGDYGPSYGPEKDRQYSLALVGAIAAPVLAAEGALVAGGAYLWSEGGAAFSQITWGSAAVNATSNATSQYLANGNSFGDINLISTASSIVPGIGPAAFGESFSYTSNKGFKLPNSFNKWSVQVSGAIVSNRFGKATDNYLAGEGAQGKVLGEFWKGFVQTFANSIPETIK
jgi:hypothetical protein